MSVLGVFPRILHKIYGMGWLGEVVTFKAKILGGHESDEGRSEPDAKESPKSHRILIFLIKLFFEYSSFTMFCQFLLYSKVTQSLTHTHTHALFFSYSLPSWSILRLDRGPCAGQQDLMAYLLSAS